jgi:hypothetical protein
MSVFVCVCVCHLQGEQRVAELLSGHPVACLLKDCGHYFKEGGGGAATVAAAAASGGVCPALRALMNMQCRQQK